MSKTTTISHFPVGNGDMTLLKIASNDQYHYVLVDMHIRQNGEPDEDKCDALEALHGMLDTDGDGRPYVDVLILTHPDEDHIRGFKDNFHRGSPYDYVTPDKGEKGKILIREMWSSPLIFRRKSKNHTLCKDALAFDAEAKRRVNLYKAKKSIGVEGDRIRLIGKDESGKTDDIMDIVYQNEDIINTLNEAALMELSANVLGPLSDDDFDDVVLDKNRSSIIIQWGIASHGYTTPSNYILLAGDASVEVWDALWNKYKNNVGQLKYDILLAPHHCSWHTLSHDSFSDSDDPQISDDAISALSEARQGAVVVSSSDSIENNDCDPPNYQAMKAYEGIVESVDGAFQCLAEYKPSEGTAPEVLVYKLTNSGPQEDVKSTTSTASKNTIRRSAATSALFSGAGNAIGHG